MRRIGGDLPRSPRASLPAFAPEQDCASLAIGAIDVAQQQILGAGQKEPKYFEKSLPDNNTERMVETLAELPFIGDPVVCLSHDQAARSGPASMRAGNNS